MLNIIWLGMIFLATIVGLIQGRLDQVVLAATHSAKLGFELALGLAGVMSLWLGMMHIASESGLVQSLAKLLAPVMVRLFPEVPKEHPAMGGIILNITANMLGLANAATPFGLQAMQDLQKLNPKEDTATDAMCTFLAINTSSVQLIPATAIAILAANGASEPTVIIFSTLVATLISTIVAIIAVKQLAKWPMFRLSREY